MSTILEDVDKFCRGVRDVRRIKEDIRRRDERIEQILDEMERAWRNRFRRRLEWRVGLNG